MEFMLFMDDDGIIKLDLLLELQPLALRFNAIWDRNLKFDAYFSKHQKPTYNSFKPYQWAISINKCGSFQF